ncbi:MAG: phosphatidylglycerophosphatase A [Chlorobiaceae bacterium]|nr:phosphatidylglycerophosphatase A [Chlorobiaceae bacterium]
MRSPLAKTVGSVLGIGYLPLAPGTFASLFAALFFFFIPASQNLQLLLPLIVLSALFGVWAGGVMEEEYGQDPSSVVIDEVAGQWIALAALPARPMVVLSAFILFRLFDILKPGLVDRAQRLPGGWGIMADDVLAGVMTNLTVHAIMALLPLLPYGFSL